MNIRITDEGDYELQIINRSSFSIRRNFSVSVIGVGWTSSDVPRLNVAVLLAVAGTALYVVAVIYFCKHQAIRSSWQKNHTEMSGVRFSPVSQRVNSANERRHD